MRTCHVYKLDMVSPTYNQARRKTPIAKIIPIGDVNAVHDFRTVLWLLKFAFCEVHERDSSVKRFVGFLRKQPISV